MDLSTTYLGLELKNPLLPSASPLSETLDGVRRLEDAGAGAVVLYSIFEEQIHLEAAELDHFLERGTESFAEALSYFPPLDEYKVGPDRYLDHVRKARESTDIPIIASLNGISTGGWISYARDLAEAGAHALELNIYFLGTDPETPGSEIEQVYVDIVEAVTSTVDIPVAVKVAPFFSSMPNMAKRLVGAGAKGLVLFNRFYQPDINVETLEVEPGVVLSRSEDLRLPLRWIAILYGRINASLAGPTGVHSATDAIKLFMAGADVAQLCAVLLQKGPQHLKVILDDLSKWLEDHGYDSIGKIKGILSQRKVAEPAAFERANYMKALGKYDT